MFHKDDVQRVKAEADIVQLCQSLGEKVTKKGRSYYIVCPFHSEDSSRDGGSCSISPARNSFHCFSCQASGSIFKLYAKLTGTVTVNNFARSVREVHQICGLSFPLREQELVHQSTTKKLAEPFTTSLPECRIEPIAGKYEAKAWVVHTSTILSGAPEELTKHFFRVNPTKLVYPLELVYLESLDMLVLQEAQSKRLVGVFCAQPRHINFMLRANKVEFLHQPVKGTSNLFELSYAVENPIDYLILAEYGYPVTFGIWGSSKKKPPFKAAVGRIPCIVQILPNKGERRLAYYANLSLDWLPRELEIEQGSISELGKDVLPVQLKNHSSVNTTVDTTLSPVI